MTRHSNRGLRKLCDCPRRKWPKCEHSWYLNFKFRGGKSYRLSLDKHLGRHIDSRSEAEAEAELIRIAIRAGKFGKPVAREDTTLRDLADLFIERYVLVTRPASEQATRWSLNRICRTHIPPPDGPKFGSFRLDDIVTDTIERFREARLVAGVSHTAVNRGLATLRAMFAWAIRVGYRDTTPFKRHGEAVVKLTVEPPRTRRLDDGEEKKLLAVCGPYLRAVIEGALETGMRRGELLSLQWKQIEGMNIDDDGNVTWAPKAELVLPSAKTKTRRDRRIPISTRLRAILTMRRFDPAGKALTPESYVFGTSIGTRQYCFRRAFHTAVLKAHGHTPKYNGMAQLLPESRAALAKISLHFHDLRREAGSRWVEGGVPLHTVRDWLGHTNISQTSAYLSGTLQTQHDAMRRYEEQKSRQDTIATATPDGLQRIATKVEKRGQERLQAAPAVNRKLNKDAVRAKADVM